MPPQPRVAVTLEQLWHRTPGGTAVAALETTRALRDLGLADQVGVAAWHRTPPPAAFVAPVPIRHLPLPRLALYEAWHRLRWPAVQRATGAVDLIHATGMAVPPRTAPLVVTLHDLAWRRFPEHATPRGQRFFDRCLELALRDADLLLASSEATRRDLLDAGADPASVRVVPLGVDSRPVAPGAGAVVRGRHGLRRPYVLWVGTLEPRKNVRTLLDAFAAVDRTDVDLVLVGPEGWNEDLRAQLAALGERVRVLGFVDRDERDALLSEAAVFCYPSLLEGFGLPVLEAMAQGAPVVTSLGTSTAEVAGDAGLLVDPRDPAAITRAITSVLDDESLAARLRAAGPARAAEFTWERTAAGTAAAYAEVVGR